MGRKKSINSRNKVIGIRITDEKFEQLKSLPPELKDEFNKSLRMAIEELLNQINEEENNSHEINVDEKKCK